MPGKNDETNIPDLPFRADAGSNATNEHRETKNNEILAGGSPV